MDDLCLAVYGQGSDIGESCQRCGGWIGVSGRLNQASSGALTLRILEVAFVLFCERGFANTTMKAIAATCPTTVRSVIRRFPTKDDLLIAVARIAGDAAAAHFNSGQLESIKDPLERLGMILWRFLLFQSLPPQMQLLRVLAGEAHRLPELATMLREHEETWERSLTALIEEAQSAGLFKRHPAPALGTAMVAMFASYPGILQLLGATKLVNDQELEAYFASSWQLVLSMAE